MLGWTELLALNDGYAVLRLQPDTLLQTRHALTKVLVVVLVLFAMLFAGKGTLRQMALQRQHLTVTTSQFLNDMVPNGIIALKYAFTPKAEYDELDEG